MDVTLKDMRLLLVALFGKTLRLGRQQVGLSFGDSVWNLIIVDTFRADPENDGGDNKENGLPCPAILIAFLAEVRQQSVFPV